jgi:hypothetical protein
VGGLIGKLIQGSVTNSYWSVTNSGQGNAVGTTDTSYNPTVSNVKGLVGDQINDVNYYIDGSIDKVLQRREEEKARKSEATDSGTSSITAVTSSPLQSAALIASASGAPTTPPSVGSRLQVEDSSSQSVNIRSIDVDGVRFNLESGAGASGGAKSDDERP